MHRNDLPVINRSAAEAGGVAEARHSAARHATAPQEELPLLHVPEGRLWKPKNGHARRAEVTCLLKMPQDFHPAVEFYRLQDYI